MPLRDDLLTPIPGENPSGVNLQYDVKVFEAVKDARQEDDDSLPTGTWASAPKKADRNLVIKVAGEALATRSKDLRLAGWYFESLLKKEGFGILAPALETMQKLEENFWETLYPEIDPDDGSLDLRIGAIEGAATLLAAQLKLIPITRTGMDLQTYVDARALGFEADPRSDEKKAIRADAVKRGRLVAEDTVVAVEATPKAFYAEVEAQLVAGLEALDNLDRLHDEKFPDDPPSLSRLKSSIEDVKKVVSSLLAEKRLKDPDPVELPPEPDLPEPVAGEESAEAVEGEAPSATASPRGGAKVPVGMPTTKDAAYLQVAACAEFLRTANTSSPVPYLLCTALRFGETRSADLADFSFAVAPPTETRQKMRKLANENKWDELMRLCIQTLPEPCGRVWLDLQRYVWKAAQGLGNASLAAIVLSTVRSLLIDFPAVRTMTLDDDTSAANTETQMWIDAEVLKQS